MLIDFCTKKTFFFINNEAQGGRKRSFGAKTHITRKRKQRAFQPMWSEISKSNTFREIFINICTNFCRGNPSLPASTIWQNRCFPIVIVRSATPFTYMGNLTLYIRLRDGRAYL